jgi:hypothetical protein
MEPLAGLIELALLMEDDAQALAKTEEILAHINKGGSLEGTDEPLRVYNICYQFLKKQKDPRAQHVLQNAKQLLNAQISKFTDEETRKRFVESFPWRKAIHEVVLA